jgi:CheY-like chemotaxis protein
VIAMSNSATSLTPPTILVYGKDENLLNTRSLLLQSTGRRVKQATTYEGLRMILQAVPVNVIVLCHTLSEADCLAALDTAAKLRPGIKSLVLTSRHSKCGEQYLATVISDFLNPGLLISVTNKLSEDCDGIQA